MPSHDTNVRYMTKVTYANLQDSARIFTYSSAANWRDDFQDLRGSIIYTHKQMEQYATVCKNVNVGRRKEGKRFSSKCRCYRFFCPLGRYIWYVTI